jgi:hypothetical protein
MMAGMDEGNPRSNDIRFSWSGCFLLPLVVLPVVIVSFYSALVSLCGLRH